MHFLSSILLLGNIKLYQVRFRHDDQIPDFYIAVYNAKKYDVICQMSLI